MPALTSIAQPLSRQWVQSGLIHGALLLCAVLYHLHSQDSLYPSVNSSGQANLSTSTSVSHNSVIFLELSIAHEAITAPQQVESMPEDVLLDAALDIALETPLELPVEGPSEVSKEAPIAATKGRQPVAKKPTVIGASTANATSRVVGARYQVAAEPLATARPDHAYSPKPAYPLALRDLGVSGVVWLRVWVDKTGRPQEIELSKGSGYRLFDEAALRAVQQWRFIPAKNEQQSLASWVEFAVRFEING